MNKRTPWAKREAKKNLNHEVMAAIIMPNPAKIMVIRTPTSISYYYQQPCLHDVSWAHF